MLRNINTIQYVFAGKKKQKCVHVSQKNASESHKRECELEAIYNY